ncbi:MAG: zinc-dependent alcohol dehydrogenase [Spirochaetales bacterium]
MKAKSLWYTAPQEVEVREIDVPEPGPGEALVEVSCCGICTWDLFIYRGGFQETVPYPFYFGHEGIGRVAKVGPGVELAEGQRVALREAKHIGAIGGGHMAELSVQDAAKLVLLPEDGVPDTEFMVEPASCCVNALNISPVRPAERVALVGSGYMGSILLQLLAMGPAKEIVVFERRDEALAYAASLRTDTPIRVIDTRETPAKGRWVETEGAFDLVVETTGVEPGFRLADSLVRLGGRFVIFSWQHHPFEFDLGTWHTRGLTVHNSSPAESWSMDHCFEQARDLIDAGRIDQSDLITHVGTPEEASRIYAEGIAKTNNYVKGVIRWR